MSRFTIGIDLGTTNCALAWIDTATDELTENFAVECLAIPQVVRPGGVEERWLLPSFLYLPMPGELPAGSLQLPWDAHRDYAVGEFARQQGALIPTRLVSSAKSWLVHPGVDRRSPILPWQAPEGVRRVSPVEASSRYLQHLIEAWNYKQTTRYPGQRFEEQDVVLTVPASFDASARELTVEAARAAGIERLTLLEEPQAAFYSWLHSHADWRKQVRVGDVILVCDVGGGTTDFTLIAVGEEAGNLILERVAVGDHILLGGDNMDLALAHHVQQKFARQGIRLDFGQFRQLAQACRLAKEKLFTDSQLTSYPVTVLGRGSRVVGGTLTSELSQDELRQVLLEGFFPIVDFADEPRRGASLGLQEIGLPYATDAAITRHLASFLRRHQPALSERCQAAGRKSAAFPTAVLFNGGVFKAPPLVARLVEVLNHWAQSLGAPPVRMLHGTDLDLAVARGAACYGLVRRGRGIRIRGGIARAYYIGVAVNLPAVPGMPPPIKAICVAPFGMEEGTEADVPGHEFGLVVGQPVQFRFFGSSTRRKDSIGTVLEYWDENELQELDPLEVTLQAPDQRGQIIPVHLHSHVTPVGTLELWCLGCEPQHRWKLEFNVRQNSEAG
ncbi:MAG: Hsp70 family protein [Gemmatales bacterium]|nr:Hsp70 family protein [Gemmatales bacterium]MDW7994148.1 Hsp70 family protein [Gemmatales bacterium]